jgi:hypothetical protein
MLIIKMFLLLESLDTLNNAELQVQAIDLVELLHQKQLSQRRQMLGANLGSPMVAGISDASGKRLGILECVARLPKLTDDSGTRQQQQPTPQTSGNSSSHEPAFSGPQIIQLPPIGSYDDDDDDEDDNGYVEQAAAEAEAAAISGTIARERLRKMPSNVVGQGDTTANEDDDEVTATPLADEEVLTEKDDGQESDAALTDQPDEQQSENPSGPTTYQDRISSRRQSDLDANVRKPRRTLAELGRADGGQVSSSSGQRRQKRQAGPVEDDRLRQVERLTNAIAQLITRSLINRMARQRGQLGQLQALVSGENSGGGSSNSSSSSNQQQTVVASQFQSVLSAARPVGQLLATDILRQSVENIPVRMANWGRLIANLIATLTVNNPVLVNSPILTRLRGSAGGLSAANANSAGDQLPMLLNTLTRVIEGLEPANLQQSDSRPTRSSLNSSSVAAYVQRAEPPTTIRRPGAATGSLDAVAKASGHDNRTADDRESEFVARLTAMTLGETNAAVQAPRPPTGASKTPRRAKTKTNKTHRRPAKANIRHKRSLGAMLMFGPFSKIYLAMMMRRMMKHQTNMVSQAVMGELVRRFLIPGFSLALGGGSGPAGSASAAGQSSLFNQARQLLIKTATTSSAAPPADSQQKMPLPISAQAQQAMASELSRLLEPKTAASVERGQTQSELVQQLGLLAPKQKTTDAECEFQQDIDADGDHLEPIRFGTLLNIRRLYKLLLNGPMAGMLTSTLDSPLVSITPNRELRINLPISDALRPAGHNHNHHHAGHLHGDDPRTMPAELRHLMRHHQRGGGPVRGPANGPPPRHGSRAPGRPFSNQFGDTQGGGQQRHHAHHHHHHRQASHQPVGQQQPIQHTQGAATFEQQRQNSAGNGPGGGGGPTRTANTIDELLSQATPNQLIEMFAKLNVTGPPAPPPNGSTQFDELARPKAPPANGVDQLKLMQSFMASMIRLTPNLGDSLRPAGNEQALMGALANENPTATESISKLADRLLNKTLADWAENVMMAQGGGGQPMDTRQQQQQRPAAQQAGPVNPAASDERELDKLMLQMSELFGGKSNGAGQLDSWAHAQRINETSPAGAAKPASNQIQITLTSDNTANLMEKLRALTSRASNATPTNTTMAAGPNAAPPLRQAASFPGESGDGHQRTVNFFAETNSSDFSLLALSQPPDFPQPPPALGFVEPQPPLQSADIRGNSALIGADGLQANAETLFGDNHHRHQLGVQQHERPPLASPMRSPTPANGEQLQMWPPPSALVPQTAWPRKEPARIRAPYQRPTEGVEFMPSAGGFVQRPIDSGAHLSAAQAVGQEQLLRHQLVAEGLFHGQQRPAGLRKVLKTQHTQPQPQPPPPLSRHSQAESLDKIVVDLRLSQPSQAAHVSPLLADDSQQAGQHGRPQSNSSGFQSAGQQVSSAATGQGEPLNNLAMALNVMNMVMLNQRLMSASNSSNWALGLAEPSSPRPVQPNGIGLRDDNNATAANTGTPELVSVGATSGNRKTAAESLEPPDGGQPASHGKIQRFPPPDQKRLRVGSGKKAKGARGKEQRARAKHKSGRAGQPTRSKASRKGKPSSTTAPAEQRVNESETLAGEREGTGANSIEDTRAANRSETNHRTSTNAIRLHNSLSLVQNVTAGGPARKPTPAPPKYIYQPLIVSSASSQAPAPVNNSSTNSSAARMELTESELDHAARWNDVLQHLDLPKRRRR